MATALHDFFIYVIWYVFYLYIQSTKITNKFANS
jgi:hypothetical protein